MKGIFRLIVVLWLLAQVILVGSAQGSMSQGQPGPRARSPRAQFEALEQAKDCSVYRSVSRRAIGEIAEYKRLKAGVVELLQKRNNELEACGRDRGIATVASEDEAILAESCPGEYERALVVNFRLATLDEELRGIAQSHRQLANTLKLQCAELPEAVELEQATAPEESREPEEVEG